MATAGRTVGFSAATVAAALITLTVFPQNFLKSMGIAGATVAVVAALSALVIAPALFALWGAKLARKGGSDAAAQDRWHRLAHAVMRRPGVVAITTAAVMLAVAAPALTTVWSAIDATVIPEDKSARVVADALAAGDGTGRAPGRRRHRRARLRGGRRRGLRHPSRRHPRRRAGRAAPLPGRGHLGARRHGGRRPRRPDRAGGRARAARAPRLLRRAGRRERRRVRRPAGGDRLAAAARRSGCSSGSRSSCCG